MTATCVTSARVTNARDLADWLLSHGHDHVTTPAAARLLGVPPEHVRQRIWPQVQAHRFFSPARGLWIPIPSRYRSWGVIPAEDFVDVMMRFLGRRYYVGWLSAAAIYGTTHHGVQVFQVAVDRQLADRDIGRVRLRFITRSHLSSFPLVHREVPTDLRHSGPALTALDLADAPKLGGGLSNAATVIHGLIEQIGNHELEVLAPLFPISAVRRLGYLVSVLKPEYRLDGLAGLVSARQLTRPTPLDPTGASVGPLDPRWSVVINAKLEPEL